MKSITNRIFGRKEIKIPNLVAPNFENPEYNNLLWETLEEEKAEHENGVLDLRDTYGKVFWKILEKQENEINYKEKLKHKKIEISYLKSPFLKEFEENPEILKGDLYKKNLEETNKLVNEIKQNYILDFEKGKIIPINSKLGGKSWAFDINCLGNRIKGIKSTDIPYTAQKIYNLGIGIIEKGHNKNKYLEKVCLN